MNKYSEQLDLLTMMTFVNRSVSYFFGLHKMYIVRVFLNSTRILCELTIYVIRCPLGMNQMFQKVLRSTQKNRRPMFPIR